MTRNDPGTNSSDGAMSQRHPQLPREEQREPAEVLEAEAGEILWHAVRKVRVVRLGLEEGFGLECGGGKATLPAAVQGEPDCSARRIASCRARRVA